MSDIITITEADLARLQSWEFEEVWRAVGYVYRRRAQAPAIEPAPVPLAPVEAPPVVLPGRAPGEKEGADYSADIPETERAGGVEATRRGSTPSNSGQRRVDAARPAATVVRVTPKSDAEPIRPRAPRTLNDALPGSNPGQPTPTCADCGRKFSRQAALGSHRHYAHAVRPTSVDSTAGESPAHPETPRAETFVLEPEPFAEPEPPAHVHRYELGRPEGEMVEGVCECGHRKLHPADLNGDISRNGKRSPNPKCPHCGKHALRDRHGYWCNGCQLEVLAS